MNSLAELYTDGIKKKLNTCWAAWLPNEKYYLGDIGILCRNQFLKHCSLVNLQINFEEVKSEKHGSIDYVSESSVEISFKTAGQINSNFQSIPKAKAGVRIGFGSEGAFVVEIPQTNISSVSNLLSLQESIIDKFENGYWDSNWVLITKVYNAPSGTFFISNSSGSIIELEAEADFNCDLAELGNAENQFSLKSQKGDIIKFIGAKDISPFFELRKLKFPIVKAPFLEVMRSFQGEIDPMHFITPELVRTTQEIKDNLYLGIVN